MRQLLSPKQFLASIIVLFAFYTSNAQAALDPNLLTNDLDNLVFQGNDLLVNISGTTLTSLTLSTKLSNIEAQVSSYQTQVTTVYNSILAESGTSLSLSDDMLVTLQVLSSLSASLGNAVLNLTAQLTNLAVITSSSTLESSLTAMLRLSDDIGEMANRILEMADKILIMADNIGLMADRILATQIIQNDNIKLVVDAILQTQTNTIFLITAFL